MSDKKFNVEIVTPDGVLFSGEAEKFFAPGYEGYFEILHNHTPYMVTLKIGEIKIVIDNKEKSFSTSGGFAEVLKNNLKIIVRTAIEAGKIDVKRAEAAKERALKRLSDREEETDIPRAEIALKKAINRIKIAGKIQ